MGGIAPLGYELHKHEIEGTKKRITKLVPDNDTVPTVQMIFEKYIELGLLSKLKTYLLQNPIRTQNNKYYNVTSLAAILRNPVYVKANARIKDYFERNGSEFYGEVNGELGLVSHDRTKTSVSTEGKKSVKNTDMDDWIVSVGFHNGIIEADIWIEAQRIMKENRDTFPAAQKSHTALVSTILRCKKCEAPMFVVSRAGYTNGAKPQYYVCTMRRASKNARCQNKNVRADIVDQAIRNELKDMGVKKESILAALKEKIKQGNQEIRQTYDPVELIEADIKRKQKQTTNLTNKLSLLEDNDDIAIDIL